MATTLGIPNFLLGLFGIAMTLVIFQATWRPMVSKWRDNLGL